MIAIISLGFNHLNTRFMTMKFNEKKEPHSEKAAPGFIFPGSQRDLQPEGVADTGQIELEIKSDARSVLGESGIISCLFNGFPSF